jgi:uncharacterized protein
VHRTLYMSIFLVIMSLLAGVVHLYLWRRLVRDTELPPIWRRVVTSLLVLLGLSLPVSMVLTRIISPSAKGGILFVPFLWMGAMMLLFLGIAAVDALKLLWKTAKKTLKKPVDADRRLFLSRLTAGGAVLSAGSLTFAAVCKGKAAPVVRRKKVFLSRFPKAMDGFKIVHLTDLHIGGTLDTAWLKEVANQVDALQADLIVITGDLVDGKVKTLLPELSPLGELKAPHGVFFVTGNHEYYSGAEEWIPAIRSLNIRVLRNEHEIISAGGAAFALAGVDDFNAARMLEGHGPDLDKALRDIPEKMETVLLAHQPRQIFKAAENDVGLLLSGHTHGGQVWPVTHLVSLQQPYNKGLFTHPGYRTQIYVSQGTGYWGPPMRLGTENEIAEIVLYRD